MCTQCNCIYAHVFYVAHTTRWQNVTGAKGERLGDFCLVSKLNGVVEEYKEANVVCQTAHIIQLCNSWKRSRNYNVTMGYKTDAQRQKHHKTPSHQRTDICHRDAHAHWSKTLTHMWTHIRTLIVSLRTVITLWAHKGLLRRLRAEIRRHTETHHTVFVSSPAHILL